MVRGTSEGSAYKRIEFEKNHELTVLLGYMGAKKVHIIEGDNEQSRPLLDSGDTFPAVAVKGKFRTKTTRINEKELLVTFQKSILRTILDLFNNKYVDEYYNKTKWLSSDNEFKTIYLSRNGSNKLRAYQYSPCFETSPNSDTEQATKNLKHGANIEIDFEKHFKNRRHYNICF